MASRQTIERQRGIQEAGQQLGALREKWPLAFPVQAQDVRPLVLGVAHQVAAEMGWSLPIHAQRASPLENGGGLLPGHALP
jgi:hypothetical protein